MTIRGVNIQAYPQSRTGEITTLDTFKRAFDDLQEAGGQAVALNPVQYVSCAEGTVNPTRPPSSYRTTRIIWPDVGQGLHPWAQTIDPDLVLLACLEAKARGLFVMLKPMVDWERGGWRGALSIAEGGAYVWTAAYHKMLKGYIDIAREARLEAFCVGTEMYQTTKDLGGMFWAGIAGYVRNQGYRGAVTYAANWGGPCDDAEYVRMRVAGAWPAFDKVGVDAYFPLAGFDVQVGQGYEQAVYEGWHRRLVEQARRGDGRGRWRAAHVGGQGGQGAVARGG